MSVNSMSSDQFQSLIDRAIDQELTPTETAELRLALRDSAATRRQYWECVTQHALIEDVLRESRGQDLADVESGDFSSNEALADELLATEPATVPARPSTRSWQLLGGAIAATLLIGLGYAFVTKQGMRTTTGPIVARLQSLTGEVQLRGADGQVRAAASGSEIASGDTLVVASEDSGAEILLNEGSTLTVDTDSLLRFAAGSPTNPALHLEQGSLAVNSGNKAAGQPLVISTPHARVTGQESRFRLFSSSSASRIELVEGKVHFQQLADGQSVEVVQDQGATAVDREHLVPGTLEFVSTPLSAGECRLQQTFLKAGSAAALSLDGKQVATANNHLIQIWDSHAGGLLEWGQVDILSKPQQLALLPHNQSLTVLSQDGSAGTWDRQFATWRSQVDRPEQFRHAALSREGRQIALAGGNNNKGETAVWQIDSPAGKFHIQHNVLSKPWTVALSDNSGFLALGRWNGLIEVYDSSTQQEIRRVKINATPRPLAITNDGHRVAAYTNKEGLVLLDGEQQTQLWPHSGVRVAVLRFSPGGEYLLAGMDDGLVRIWSTASGEPLLVLETGETRVLGLELSADLTTLLTLGRGESVKIWNCVWPHAGVL